jgi:hypothetical protein
VHGFGVTYHRLGNCFGQTMGLLGDVGQMEACFGLFLDSAISTQDRCMVCVELVIGSEIILDAPDGTPR